VQINNPKSLDVLLGTTIGGPNGSRINEPGHTVTDYINFKDLIYRMLEFDPEQRITPLKALSHVFIKRAADQP
jgi:dual specificity tyrosine-phosphorylation-regulated kinase 1